MLGGKLGIGLDLASHNHFLVSYEIQIRIVSKYDRNLICL